MANTVTLTTVTPGGASKDTGSPGLRLIALADATASFDEISNDAAVTVEVTIAGAAQGDFVLVAPTGGDPEPNIFQYYGIVKSANTVEIGIHSTTTDTPALTGVTIAILRMDRRT